MDLVDRLAKIYTGAAHDVMLELGLRDFTLPPQIRPLFPERALAGVVATVSGHVDASADRHATLLGWTGLLSKARPNTVLVCQPNDSKVAHMGELSAETLQLKRVRGYVVDGGCRDNAFIRKIGFPVFASYQTPRDVVAAWKPEAYGEPIAIGQVRIATGDWVLADIDGIVVIPERLAEEAVARCEEVMRTENQVRKAILEGMDPKEAYLRYGKF